VELAPRFTPAEAENLAAELFAVTGTASPLPSERDQNFRIRCASGESYVLKIANAAEAREELDLQNSAMQHLEEKLEPCRVPRVVAAREGAFISSAVAPSGTRHFVRLLTYLPGVCLANVKPHTPELLADLGRTVARMDRALLSFEHPRMHREFYWDLKRLLERRPLIEYIADPQRRGLATAVLERFEARVAPLLDGLRSGVIHNDANDFNVLVSLPDSSPRHIAGILDFGDIVYAPLICDLAVAASYALLGKPQPLRAAASVVAGYNAALPLEERELALLYDLICARLSLSVMLSAYQHSRAPENDYLRVSEAHAWAALENLQQVSAEWAEAMFRHACGLEPCPAARPLCSWLRQQAERFAPVVYPPPDSARVHVFDFSVGSLELDPFLDPADEASLYKFVSRRLRETGAELGVSRHNEARFTTRADFLRSEGNDGSEWRSVHLGVDLFLPAGSPVFAPLDSVIFALQERSAPLECGPAIVLEHEFPAGRFYALYGGLSHGSLELRPRGARVARGEKIGELAGSGETGEGTGRLHFQIFAALPDRRSSFPAWCAPAEREVWLSLCPDPNIVLRIPTASFPAPEKTAEEILRSRATHMGPSLSLSYRRPLHLVRGFMQYLWDADGRVYLDAINNVPHVGHCHPRVVRAGQRQMAVLNTNTRYLYAPLARYVERLTALLPEPLRVCFLVCSGSEANELALRLARAHTGRKDIIVVEGGYHGNTTSLIEVSHYKFAGPGGQGPAPHVHVVPMPDTFRGQYRASDPRAAENYARHVTAAIHQAEAAGTKIGAFLMESLPSSGGMIVPPAGYLREVYQKVRAAGGVCIADEVQVGFGRTGSHFWAFEAQGVVPDIVTLGKPIGNGHPLAAVITSREIAESFATGMEYFNTFGGNPVSCAIGLAVLEVLSEERLQENALRVGNLLLDGLRRLQRRFPLIGDVRGSGFFIGAELVRSRETLEPAASEAAYIAERMRDRGILISTEGPRHNVLKIRPPMVFTAEDAARLLETLEIILQEDFVCRGTVE
jgi:4-aminobutyrate aminotransferase-like enzyme/Ser/Thr protein kinase RdoA (MazF antagonist)